MKDRLGMARWWNRPLENPTQNIFRRFVKTPGGGLPDMLDDTRKRFAALTENRLKPRIWEADLD